MDSMKPTPMKIAVSFFGKCTTWVRRMLCIRSRDHSIGKDLFFRLYSIDVTIKNQSGNNNSVMFEQFEKHPTYIFYFQQWLIFEHDK